MMEAIFHYYEEIDSTNEEIKRLIRSGCPEATVASAGTQTAGKGRRGHSWISPVGVSVATSIALYPVHVPTEKIPRLTIVSAMAVAEAVEELYPLKTQIKWPNDILINNRKICGILTEADASNNHVNYVVVGIGVNVHHRSFPPEIADMATSLDIELDRLRQQSSAPDSSSASGEALVNNIPEQASRKAVTEAIWRHFLYHYERFEEKAGSLDSILSGYNERLVNKDRQVRILDPKGEYEATALGMNSEGKLTIRLADGTTRDVDSGEVHVRGLYGYT